MTLVVAQVAALFENQSQMAIPHETRIQLQSEGIYSPADLAEFNEDAISKISNRLKKPGVRVLNITPGAVIKATIPISPFIFGAKSQVQLIEA